MKIGQFRYIYLRIEVYYLGCEWWKFISGWDNALAPSDKLLPKPMMT